MYSVIIQAQMYPDSGTWVVYIAGYWFIGFSIHDTWHHLSSIKEGVTECIPVFVNIIHWFYHLNS